MLKCALGFFPPISVLILSANEKDVLLLSISLPLLFMDDSFSFQTLDGLINHYLQLFHTFIFSVEYSHVLFHFRATIFSPYK